MHEIGFALIVIISLIIVLAFDPNHNAMPQDYITEARHQESISLRDSILGQTMLKIETRNRESISLRDSILGLQMESISLRDSILEQTILRIDTLNQKAMLQDSILEQTMQRIDTIQYVKRNVHRKMWQVFKEEKAVKIGDKASFVISGEIGDFVSIKDLTGKNIIASEYKIYPSGKKEESYELILDSTIFALTSPIQAFSVTSTDFVGMSEILVHLENKQGDYNDSIKIHFQEKEIFITVADTVDIMNTKSGQYEITYEIAFSSPIMHDLYLDVVLNLEVNSRIEQIKHHLYIPIEATKLKKSFIFNSHRQLYYLNVGSIMVVNVIDTDNKYVKYNFSENNINLFEEK